MVSRSAGPGAAPQSVTTIQRLRYKGLCSIFRRRALLTPDTAAPTIKIRRGRCKAIMSTVVAGKGLEGIVAANSGICWIDGEAGVLAYRGIDIHELAENSNFEETTYLLWNGRLPSELELREFSSQLALARSLDKRIIDLIRSFPTSATP